MNRLERDEFERLRVTLRGADEVNIIVRKDAQDLYFEADWLADILESALKWENRDKYNPQGKYDCSQCGANLQVANHEPGCRHDEV